MSNPVIVAAIAAISPLLAAQRKLSSLLVDVTGCAATFDAGEAPDANALVASLRKAGVVALEFERHAGGAVTLSATLADGHAFRFGASHREFRSIGDAVGQGYMPEFDVTETPPAPTPVEVESFEEARAK
jgi:hypothetical protein